MAGKPFLTICGVRLSDAVADEEALAVFMADVATVVAPADAAPPPAAATVAAVAVALSCFSTASVMDDSCGAKKERRAARGSLLLSLQLFAIAIAMRLFRFAHAFD